MARNKTIILTRHNEKNLIDPRTLLIIYFSYRGYYH